MEKYYLLYTPNITYFNDIYNKFDMCPFSNLSILLKGHLCGRLADRS